MGFARVGSNPTVVDNFLRAMDSASDFGSGGWGFESPQGLVEQFFGLVLALPPLVPIVVASLAEWLRRWL
jgi:hypothetical protein